VLGVAPASTSTHPSLFLSHETVLVNGNIYVCCTGSTTSMAKVMCTGTFDILHPGHLNYFQQAKQQGDYLIVVVATDKSVEQEKGKLPRNTAEKRREEVEKVDIVDKAVVGNEGDKLLIVEQEKPDVIVLGYDQNMDEEKLKAALAQRGLTPKIIRANAYMPEKYKSSLIQNQ